MHTGTGITGLRARSDAHMQPLPPQVVSANFRHLIGDIVWYGILVGTTINLMQVYVVRLGAPSLLVGAVTYGPALISIFWGMPAAALMRRSGRRMDWMLRSAFLHRIVYPVIALLPFLLQGASAQPAVAALTVLALGLQAFATTLSSISFLSVMADAVPADQMSQLVTWRNVGFGVTSTLSTLLASLLLARLPFPLSYQILFLIGFAGSMMSQWNVAQLCVPDRAALAGVVVGGAGRPRQELGRALRLPRFLSFAAVVGVLQMSLGMVSPLLPLFAVRRMGATDPQISLVVTAVSASSVLGSFFMRRMVRRLGRERVLAAGALGYAFYPFLLAAAPSVLWLIPCALVGGFFSAAISVTLFDNLVAITPNEDRTSYVAVYNLFVNTALFAGPLLAALLAHTAAGPALGLRVAAAISLLSGVLFLGWMRRPNT